MPEAGLNLNFSIIDVNEYLPLLGRCCGWCIHIFLAVTLTCLTILYRKQQLASAWRCLLYTLPTVVLLTSCQKSQEWQRVRILAVALSQWLQGLKEKLLQLPCPSLEVTMPSPRVWSKWANSIYPHYNQLDKSPALAFFSLPCLIFPLPNHGSLG